MSSPEQLSTLQARMSLVIPTALAGSNLGGDDAFVRKYKTDGTIEWTKQFGTPQDDFPTGIAVDASGVYVVGRTAVFT